MRDNEYFIGSETKSFSEHKVFKAEQYIKTVDYNPVTTELKTSKETGLEEQELIKTTRKAHKRADSKTLREIVGKTAGGITTAAVAATAAAVIMPALLDLDTTPAPTVNGFVIAADAFSYDFAIDSEKEYILTVQGGSGSGVYTLVDGDGIITGLTPEQKYAVTLTEKGDDTPIISETFTTKPQGDIKALFDVDTALDYESGLAHADCTAYLSGYELCETLGVSPLLQVAYKQFTITESYQIQDGLFSLRVEDVAEGELDFILLGSNPQKDENNGYGTHTETIRFADDFTPFMPTVYEVQASAPSGLAEVSMRCDDETANFYCSAGGEVYGEMSRNAETGYLWGESLISIDKNFCDITVYYERASGMLSPVCTQNNIPCSSPTEYGVAIKEEITDNLSVSYGEESTRGYLVTNTGSWGSSYFSCALELTDESGRVISYQSGTGQLSFEIPISNERVRATLYKTGQYYDGEKVFEKVDLGELDFTRPTLTLGEKAELTSEGWHIPFTVTRGAMRVDSADISIYYDTASSRETETVITYGQQQYFFLGGVPGGATYANTNGYLDFTDIYGNTGSISVPEITYQLADTFEIERVEYNKNNGTLQVTTRKYFSSATQTVLRNKQTGEEVKDSNSSISQTITDGAYEYELYETDTDGNVLTPIKTFTVDTSLASGVASMNAPQYTQILTTYNDNNTMNLYPIINFSSEDTGLQAEVVIGQNKYYRTRDSVCAIEDLIYGDYVVAYNLIREVDGVVYLIENTSYSGSIPTFDLSTIDVNSVYDETTDQTTVTITLNTNYIYDTSTAYLEFFDKTVQIPPENIVDYQAEVIIDGNYTWGYLHLMVKHNNADKSAVENYITVKGSTEKSITIDY
jgi:hypothetical protein